MSVWESDTGRGPTFGNPADAAEARRLFPNRKRYGTPTATVKLTEDEQEMIRTVLTDIIETDQGGGWEPKHWAILVSARNKVERAKARQRTRIPPKKRSSPSKLRGIRSAG